MTRRTSLVAVCCSRDSVRSRFRVSSSVNRRTFSMAMTAWSAKGFSSETAGPRRSGRPRRRRSPRWLPLANTRIATTLRKPRSRANRGTATPRWPGREDRRSSARRPTDPGVTDSRPPQASSSVPTTPCRAARRRRPRDRDQDTDGRPAEPDGAADTRCRRRLDVHRRPGDRREDLSARHLLLQRLGQIAIPDLQLLEEANILDGDDGLVGEHAKQLDLRVAEPAGLRPAA